ncbi:MAG TPA: hypothetical protein VFB16_12585 [Bauldia sp.]|nr:hypothetical protein [Bauldia sp.]
MNKPFLGVGALALSLALLAPAAPAEASDVRPHSKGLSCFALSKSMPKSQIWHARFYGERQELGFRPPDFDVTASTRQAPCFKTRATCENWLYWMMSEWPDMQRFQRCRQGLKGIW